MCMPVWSETIPTLDEINELQSNKKKKELLRNSNSMNLY
jgi:hypothetical protein